MLAIADYADDDGAGVYPSAARLARKIRVETRSARRLLAALRDDGDIVAVGHTSGGVTIYRIDLIRLCGTNQEDARGTPPDHMSGGDPGDRGPLTLESGPPDPRVSHSPSVNPSSTPPPPAGSGSVDKNLKAHVLWPPGLDDAERKHCMQVLHEYPHDLQQQFLRALGEVMAGGRLKKAPHRYLAGCAKKYSAGMFTPSSPAPRQETDVERIDRLRHEKRKKLTIEMATHESAAAMFVRTGDKARADLARLAARKARQQLEHETSQKCS